MELADATSIVFDFPFPRPPLNMHIEVKVQEGDAADRPKNDMVTLARPRKS